MVLSALNAEYLIMSIKKGSKGNDDGRRTVIDQLMENVEQLYEFRDHYFETHSIEEASEKSSNVNNKLKETMRLFDEEYHNVETKDRAQYYYLLGRALNVSAVYDPKAEEALSKAIKLDMKLYEAWNELGESYWKKENIAEAKNCFQGALKHKKNKKSLRNLSMVLRMEQTGNRTEKTQNVEEGMKCAKEAVELDPKDGTSWSVLGNAYLSSFFHVSQNPSVLSLCKSAYNQAEKDIVAKSNPDLHYNKGIVAKYEEDYISALSSFQQAIRLEPSWSEAAQKESQLLTYLDKIDDLIRNKGKMKGKKLSKYLEKMNSVKHLGPYAGGKYCAKNGAEIKVEHVEFQQLKEGINEEKVILGVVVCSVQEGDNVPFTFVIVDNREHCLAVTVYNLAQGKGVLIGDYVAIPEPFLSHVNINYQKKKYSFNSVRIVSPLVMVVNGKKVDKSLQCGLQFSTFSMAD